MGPAKARHAEEDEEELSVPRPDDEELDQGVADEEKMPAALSPQFNTIDFPRAVAPEQPLPSSFAEPEDAPPSRIAWSFFAFSRKNAGLR